MQRLVHKVFAANGANRSFHYQKKARPTKRISCGPRASNKLQSDKNIGNLSRGPKVQPIRTVHASSHQHLAIIAKRKKMSRLCRVCMEYITLVMT